MIDKNITKIFNRKNKRPGAGITAYISNPKHAWKIIICIFAVLNICIIAFSVYLFLEINNVDIFKIKQDATITVDTIDRALLRETLLTFEKMENELEELKNNRPIVIDPSL